MFIGESFEGSGANAAHVNIVAGPKDGPVGTAWATALASPSAGHVPFLVVLQPGLPVKPATVFINKSALQGETHERLTWGAAQAGVAKGIQECESEGILPPEAADAWCIIAAVWVDPAAGSEELVFQNNYHSARNALTNAIRSEPSIAAVREAAVNPHNPFFTQGAS